MIHGFPQVQTLLTVDDASVVVEVVASVVVVVGSSVVVVDVKSSVKVDAGTRRTLVALCESRHC
jgi:hypothetical protein